MPPPIRTGPTVPTTGSVARRWPLSDGPAEFDGGFWGQRQRVNRERSISAGLEHLARHGQLDDLRRAAGKQEGPHTGRPYSDSERAEAGDPHPSGTAMPARPLLLR